jgi:hypothetical protein
LVLAELTTQTDQFHLLVLLVSVVADMVVMVHQEVVEQIIVQDMQVLPVGEVVHTDWLIIAVRLVVQEFVAKDTLAVLEEHNVPLHLDPAAELLLLVVAAGLVV